jgi:hypothetical protein
LDLIRGQIEEIENWRTDLKMAQGNQVTRRLLLFTFFLEKLPEWLLSRRIFRLVWPSNPTKHAPTSPPETPLSRIMVRSGRKI